jgi:D-beta-D-heptose 7-phosphate kinase/D-beta-D-heptose 1-phosphate adenosyltransferase
MLIELARGHGVPVLIDPKGVDYTKYRGATVVKPNQLEAGKVLNRDLRTEADVDRAAADLAALLGPDTAVLITRGPHGMSLFEPGRGPIHVPAQAREVYDVTGAGDTVAATMALALAAGVGLATACRLASLAAAVVVAKVGTATCSLEELAAAGRSTRG